MIPFLGKRLRSQKDKNLFNVSSLKGGVLAEIISLVTSGILNTHLSGGPLYNI